jgi:hypothetical protein
MFEIAAIAPGEYTVTAFFSDQGTFYSTQEDMEVVNADVDRLTLVIVPGVDIPGQLVWDGKPSLEGERATIYLAPESGDIAPGGEAHVDENSQFTLKEVPQGTFRISVDGISKDCYIKEVQFGEVVLPEHVLHAKRGVTGPLDITISSKGARLQGVVANDESLPVAGVWVVAVPDLRSEESLSPSCSISATEGYSHCHGYRRLAGKMPISRLLSNAACKYLFSRLGVCRICVFLDEPERNF